MYLAKEYKSASQLQFQDAVDCVEEFDIEISKMSGNCLDIGCGPGEVTRELILPRLDGNANLVGADISKQMVDYAKKLHGDEDRLSFIQLDIETSMLPKDQVGRYDNVLSFYCLHWCKNTRQAFQNIYELLSPGGKALVLFLGWNDGFDSYVRIHKDPQYKAYSEYMQDVDRFVPHFHRCNASRAALKNVLEDIGFEVLHCSRRERSYVFSDIQNLKDHMVAVNPFISRMPDNLKEDFKEILVREIASKKIHFVNKADNGEMRHSILDRYYVLMAYMQKPHENC